MKKKELMRMLGFSLGCLIFIGLVVFGVSCMFIHSDFAKECSLFYDLKECDEYEYGVNSLAKCCFFGDTPANQLMTH